MICVTIWRSRMTVTHINAGGGNPSERMRSSPAMRLTAHIQGRLFESARNHWHPPNGLLELPVLVSSPCRPLRWQDITRWKQSSGHQFITTSFTRRYEGKEVQKKEMIRYCGHGSILSELKLFVHAVWIPSGLPTTLSETKCSLL